MAENVHDRDVLIMATVPRFTPPTDRGMFLTPPAAIFKVGSNGAAAPASFRFQATLLNMSGAVAFAFSEGLTPEVTGNEVVLEYSDMAAVSGTITATITVDGVLYTQVATVTKVADGASGVSTYTWVKYADTAAGAGLSDDPTGKAYIGLAYNKSTPIESTTPADYAWSLIKGEPGQPGGRGDDGATLYTWIKYSDVADGTGMYDVPTDATLYIGLAVNKATAVESTNKADYVWSRFRGGQGVPGDPGLQGVRGNVDISAVTTSSVWSDAQAVAALAAAGYGAPQVRDMVNLYRADRTFSDQKMYNGSAWIAVDYVWNGNVFVKGSILPEAIDTRGLTIRDAQGNVILGAGTGLPESYAPPSTLNSALAPALNAAATRGAALNDDPGILNLAAWNLSAGVEYRAVGGLISPGHFGCREGLNKFAEQNRRFAVDPAKTYNLSALLYTAAGNTRNMYIYINFYNSAGTRIYGLNPEGIGWGGSMSGYVYGGTAAPGWARYGATFGAGERDRPIPAGTVAAEIGVWFQYEGGPGSSQVDQAAQDLRCEEVTLAYSAAKAAADARYIADAAISRTEAMSADGILSRSEKIDLLAEWLDEDAVWAQVRAQANNLGVSYADYDAKHKATSDYLLGLNPSWKDTSKDTNIDRETHNGYFTRMYEARVALQNAISAKAATTAVYDNVNNRPQDTSNLVRKSNVDDNSMGQWQAFRVEPLDGFNAESVPAKVQLVHHARDCLEMGNTFYVTPNETIYFGVWLNTQDTPYDSAFGMMIFNSAGNVVQYVLPCTLSPGTGWRYLEGSFTVPGGIGAVNAMPWLFQSGFDFSTTGWLRATGMWIGRHARGATVGATIGHDLFGQMTRENISAYIQAAAIGLALIDKASIGELSALSARFGVMRTADSGARIEVRDNLVVGYGENNIRRWQWKA